MLFASCIQFQSQEKMNDFQNTLKKLFGVNDYYHLFFFLIVASLFAVASFFFRVTHPSFAAADLFLNKVSFDLAII